MIIADFLPLYKSGKSGYNLHRAVQDVQTAEEESTMTRELHPNISVRVFNDQKCFGPGLAELLRRVEEHRSLRAAALSMKMAYSKAWTILHTAEDALGFKLLDLKTGGKNGGGATLTEEGRRMLAAYVIYCDRLRAYGEELFREEFAFYYDHLSGKK